MKRLLLCHYAVLRGTSSLPNGSETVAHVALGKFSSRQALAAVKPCQAGRERPEVHSESISQLFDQCGALPCFEAEALNDHALQDTELQVESAEESLNDNEMAAVEVTQTAEL